MAVNLSNIQSVLKGQLISSCCLSSRRGAMYRRKAQSKKNTRHTRTPAAHRRLSGLPYISPSGRHPPRPLERCRYALSFFERTDSNPSSITQGGDTRPLSPPRFPFLPFELPPIPAPPTPPARVAPPTLNGAPPAARCCFCCCCGAGLRSVLMKAWYMSGTGARLTVDGSRTSEARCPERSAASATGRKPARRGTGRPTANNRVNLARRLNEKSGASTTFCCKGYG